MWYSLTYLSTHNPTSHSQHLVVTFLHYEPLLSARSITDLVCAGQCLLFPCSSPVTVFGGQANGLGIYRPHHIKQTSEQFLCPPTCVTADRIAVLISHINITLVVIVVCHNEWLYSFPCSSQKLPSADAYWAFVNVWMSLLSFHFVTVRSRRVFSSVSHRFSFSFSSPGPFVLAFVFSPTGPQKLIFSLSSHRTSWGGGKSDRPCTIRHHILLCPLHTKCTLSFIVFTHNVLSPNRLLRWQHWRIFFFCVCLYALCCIWLEA